MALESFKRGFEKKADKTTSGGKGFAGGRGKGNLQGDYVSENRQGNSTRRKETGSWSLERGPQSYSVFDNGIIRSEKSNPHIKY